MVSGARLRSAGQRRSCVQVRDGQWADKFSEIFQGVVRLLTPGLTTQTVVLQINRDLAEPESVHDSAADYIRFGLSGITFLDLWA